MGFRSEGGGGVGWGIGVREGWVRCRSEGGGGVRCRSEGGGGVGWGVGVRVGVG